MTIERIAIGLVVFAILLTGVQLRIDQAAPPLCLSEGTALGIGLLMTSRVIHDGFAMSALGLLSPR